MIHLLVTPRGVNAALEGAKSRLTVVGRPTAVRLMNDSNARSDEKAID